jgi:uncharacterized protein
MNKSADDAVMIDLARNPGVVALVGFSPKPDRPSHGVAHYLIEHGIKLYLINPECAGQDHLGRTVLASLADVPEHIHIVDIFRRAENVPPIVEEAIEVHADAIWLQLGITNPEAEARARAAGLLVVANHCLKIEHALYA